MNVKIVVAWHNKKQLDKFLEEWGVDAYDPRLMLQQDIEGRGCARTKNLGIRNAYRAGADIICVLDDDCYPEHYMGSNPLTCFIEWHIKALEPQPVRMVWDTTDPPSRGTPYRNRDLIMPVAASMGFWTEYPDFDAITALHLGETAKVEYLRQVIYGRYFPFCGMNFAFRREWIDYAQLINVPRWDDIWMGWIWQKGAYDNRCCFNLNGPTVRHSRQSNVWQNLREEVKYVEQNETLWAQIALSQGCSAEMLRQNYINPILYQGGDKNGGKEK